MASSKSKPQQQTEYGHPSPCSELMVLQNVVETTTKTLTELKHEILGNSKKGMKQQLSDISKTVEQILPVVKDMSEERTIRRIEETEREKQALLQKEEEQRRKKSWKAVGMVLLEKFASPLILALALYWLLGIK